MPDDTTEPDETAADLDQWCLRRYILLYQVMTYDDPDARDEDIQDLVTAEAILADLDRGDIPCRFIATGHDYDMAGPDISWHSTARRDGHENQVRTRSPSVVSTNSSSCRFTRCTSSGVRSAVRRPVTSPPAWAHSLQPDSVQVLR
jgi:hypothetical protein